MFLVVSIVLLTSSVTGPVRSGSPAAVAVKGPRLNEKESPPGTVQVRVLVAPEAVVAVKVPATFCAAFVPSNPCATARPAVASEPATTADQMSAFIPNLLCAVCSVLPTNGNIPVSESTLDHAEVKSYPGSRKCFVT